MYDVIFWCKRCPGTNWTLCNTQLCHLHSYAKAEAHTAKSDFRTVPKISVGTFRLLSTSDDNIYRIFFAQKMRINVTITMGHSDHHMMHSSISRPSYRKTQVHPEFAPIAHRKKSVYEVKWTCMTLFFGAKDAQVQTEHFGTHNCGIYIRMQRQKPIQKNQTFGLWP